VLREVVLFGSPRTNNDGPGESKSEFEGRLLYCSEKVTTSFSITKASVPAPMGSYLLSPKCFISNRIIEDGIGKEVVAASGRNLELWFVFNIMLRMMVNVSQ